MTRAYQLSKAKYNKAHNEILFLYIREVENHLDEIQDALDAIKSNIQ